MIIDRNELVAVGIVRKPFGVRGQCAVSGFGSTLSVLSAPVRLWVGTDAQVARQMEIVELSQNAKGFLCRFAGCEDMDAAGAFREHYLFCEQKSLPDLGNGQHYSFELVGLTVVAAEDDSAIGVVVGVESYPTVDSLEVRCENGTTILVSLTPGVVQDVDKPAGRIIVNKSAIEEMLA
jgi:16S rRNA processing protein RimM